MQFTISEEQKLKFKTIILINEIINSRTVYDNKTFINIDTRRVFDYMVEKRFLEVTGTTYKATEEGRTYLDLFYKKYFEYLKVFDLYGFVDLEKGEFAFSKFFDLDGEQWEKFKKDERWSDVRIAVAIFKKLDPTEIVFMSYVSEERFDLKTDSWEEILLSPETWTEMEAICNTAINKEELEATNDGFMEDMIKQGSAVLQNLMKVETEMENERMAAEYPDQGEEVVTTTTTTTEVIEEEEVYVSYVEPYYYDYDYFDPYYSNIYYVSPLWLLVW